MGDYKSWIASRGVWGGLIAVFAAGAALFHHGMSTADQAQLTDLAVSVAGGVGGILAIIGRIFATKQIG